MSEMVATELMRPIRRRVTALAADEVHIDEVRDFRDVNTQSQTVYARWRAQPRFILSTYDSVQVGRTHSR